MLSLEARLDLARRRLIVLQALCVAGGENLFELVVATPEDLLAAMGELAGEALDALNVGELPFEIGEWPKTTAHKVRDATSAHPGGRALRAVSPATNDPKGAA